MIQTPQQRADAALDAWQQAGRPEDAATIDALIRQVTR